MKKQLAANIGLLALSVMVYAANIWVKKQPFSYDLSFVRYHMNDTVATVLVLAYAGIWLNYCGRNSVSSAIGVFLLCSVCGFFWEAITPLFLKRSTADYKDVLCYYLGGSLYYAAINITIYVSKKKGEQIG